MNTNITLEDILKSVEEILPNKTEMVLLTLAICISPLVDHQTPLWLMFVGVPASGKTEVVRLISDTPFVKPLDSLTENAFVSGAINPDKTKPKDLLPLLDGKCFIIKDFTTTLSQREESVKKILGDLTSIYDDTFQKHSAMRGTISYHSFFSILGCVTPQALNQHQRYMNQIGPRFLFYRVPLSNEDEIDKALNILWTSETINQTKEKVHQMVLAYLQNIYQRSNSIVFKKEPIEVQTSINNFAKFIAKARGIVLTRQAKFTNEDGKEITFYEPYEIQIEEPHRAVRQLRVLARSLALVSNNQTVASKELSIVKKVALSSMPADRSALISIISKENKKWTAKEIADSLGISHKTASRQLDELVSLEILDKEEQGIGLANNYSVKNTFKKIIYDEEFMSSPTMTKTKTPHQSLKQSESENVTLEDIDNLFGIESIT
ncbi:MAG: hypothetical protein M1324_01190 [Patescibacteria group bacterium]|nr:hypothetical protein [Patescibacteria group bacterium]